MESTLNLVSCFSAWHYQKEGDGSGVALLAQYIASVPSGKHNALLRFL